MTSDLIDHLSAMGRLYRMNQCRSQDRKRLRELIRIAADQSMTIAEIAEATTLCTNTVRKYIRK